MTTTRKQFLTPGEVALALGIPTRTVNEEINKRRLCPILRINRKTKMVPIETFEKYKKERMS